MTISDDFANQFAALTGYEPFPFQRRFAETGDLSALVNIPTGLGKTAMVVIGWLWRRERGGERLGGITPRRLVYCLPMRVLVEQTAKCARLWIRKGRQAGILSSDVPVYVLMGGEDEGDWDINPEGDAIIIGTQDMLLSRALNRGYGASRSRWPMQFGLLHTDCLWVFDEIQLMGSGLATTTQLEAFRRLLGTKDGHGCCSVWMSATLDAKWLETVDFKEILRNLPPKARLAFDFNLEIVAPGIDPKAKKAIEDRWNASKPLQRTGAKMGESEELADAVVNAHKPGTRTIIVINTVKRACKLHRQIGKQWGSTDTQRLVLLHSRFRPDDRKALVDKALGDPPSGGTIIVSTQVIEAGMDVSATTLFTELAPWPSLVQRFGRCNRKGEENRNAAVHWIDLPSKEADAEKLAAPYTLDDLKTSAQELAKLGDVGLQSLPDFKLRFDHAHVIRKRDLIDLFDTTPDLAGNDIDIDRFVREVEDSDVRVFWREWDTSEHKGPPDDKRWRRIGRDELCPVPIGSKTNPGFKEFARKYKGKVWRWDFLDAMWRRVDGTSDVYPGQSYLLHASAGGYAADTGWVGAEGKAAVGSLGPFKSEGLSDDDYDDEGFSKTDSWQMIAAHTDEVCRELDGILLSLSLNNSQATMLRTAARWHDWGKAHEKFQAVLPEGAPRVGEFWAKASGIWKRYRDVGRPHFRHELASALAVLQRPHSDLDKDKLNEDELNLVACLIAAHHGKVRLSIRSLPNEARPRDMEGKRLSDCRFARGVWEGDTLPETNLGGGVTAPPVTLSLEPMELGLCEQPPFAGQPSWAERMIRLCNTLGPFRLAFLEALLRAADMRASRNADQNVSESPAMTL